MIRRLNRRLNLFCLWIVACTVWAAGAAEGVPHARDLARDGDAAAATQAVVLVAFVGADCPYCEMLLREFLVPMSRNPDYQSRVVMRRVEIGSHLALRDFSGWQTEHGDFASRHGVRFVPTIMMFDRAGHTLTKPLVGLGTRDYFGADLDATIDEAYAKAQQGKATFQSR